MSRIIYPLSISYMRRRLALAIFFPFDTADVENRGLNEGRSQRYKLKAEDLKQCKYPDSRGGARNRNMNIGALAQLRNYRELIIPRLTGIIAALGLAKKQHERVLLIDMWRVAHFCRAVPLQSRLSELTNKSENYATVEACTSVLFKVSFGILDTISEAVKMGHHVTDCWSPEDYYNFANSQGRLIGRNEVCAAPKQLFISFLQDFSEAFYLADELSEKSRAASYLEYRTSMIISDIQWKLHVFSYAFELARVVSCKKNLSAENNAYIFSRHTTPYCNDAVAASNEAKPLEADITAPFIKISFNNGTDESLDFAFIACINWLEDVINIKPPEQYLSDNESGLNKALVFLQCCEDALFKLIVPRIANEIYRYTISDLEHFFGDITSVATTTK
ncbi:hypothetical protein [Pseudomonas syringae]|uniref:hypothetical protein n=1 Tax=Pseudomonas syringae TaxID=317 RepID=UPI0024E0B034|nr:hypothetical protein [Pseudomonas syringae]